MRYALIGLMLTMGTAIGINSINAISNIQDAKMQRLCKVMSNDVSYREICKDYR